MPDKHVPLGVVRVPSRSPPPDEGPGRGIGPAVAAESRVVQERPHEPDLGDAEAVDHHQLPVEAGVKGLQVGRRRRLRDPEGAEALVVGRFEAHQLEAHSQEDVIDGKQLHLVARSGVTKGPAEERERALACSTCSQAELSLRAVYPDMTKPPPPA